MAPLAEQFPGSADAMASLVEVVRAYRREAARDPLGLELEMRFGHTAPGATHVVAGVSADFVDRVIGLVQTNPEVSVGDWAEVTDAFYDVVVGRRGGEREERRSRTRYDTERLCLDTQVVCKRRIAECHLRCADVGVRVVASRETPVAVSEAAAGGAADLVAPKHVRVQQRKTATFARHDLGPTPTWAIDVSMVWSGDSKSAAERRQMESECPQYTLEMELVDARYVAAHDDDYVACSLAMKAADLLAGELAADATVHLVPVAAAVGA